MSFLEGTSHHIIQEHNQRNDIVADYEWRNGSIDDTMPDLNEEIPIQTPSKPVSRLPSHNMKNSIQSNEEDIMDCESTLAGESQDERKDTNDTTIDTKDKHFDIIAMNVNKTIQELNTIYNQIGYSTTEISIKKSEIFTVIEDTIANFTSSLQREKNNIENECEWLRQQIRIILAMINDNQGEKSLPLMDRGVIFSSKPMYEQGYKDELLAKLANIQNRKQDFYADSPFNITSTGMPETDFSFESQYEHMLKHIPQLSLLQLKNKLNSIFLEVLKLFIKSFTKLNDLSISYIELCESIGECYSPNANVMLLKTLPNKEEAEEHRSLIDQFESTLEFLNLSKKDSKIEPIMNLKSKNDDEYAVIISSPRKAHKNTNHGVSELNGNEKDDNQKPSTESLMSHLRDLNYKIVRVIRSLKFTKITPEFLSDIQKEIDHCEIEFNARENEMKEIINKCFTLINALNLTEDQIINIQKQYDITKKKNANEGYFDMETLKFIQSNPREFGLNDSHINFINRFANVLQKIKDAKQKKWDHYLSSCEKLWMKLGESNEYTNSFLSANDTLTDISLINFKMELNRLYVKRSEFIENFIMDARVEIENLWNKMYLSEEQRTQFSHYNYNMREDYDKETVLHEHEAELSKLTKEYQSKENILTMFSQLNELIKDQHFLKESSKDSSRLLSKNSCKILLNEEKIRKRIIKSMPKLMENLKSEVIKYNHSQLNQGEKPFMISGEDFFEKLLVIESEQVQQNSNRNGRNRFRNKGSESPSKQPTTTRSSPMKPIGRSPTSQGKRNHPNNNPIHKARGPSPMNSKKSPIKISPLTKQSSITKIASRHSKPKTINSLHPNSKLTQAINMSLSSHSDSGSNTSLDSPTRTATRSNSNMSRFMEAHLHPLNSPLTFNNEEGTRIFHDNDDLTNHSNISKISPLRFNTSSNLSNNFNIGDNKLNLTPIQKYGFIDHSYIDDKENKHSSINKFGLSPIKVIEINEEDKENTEADKSFKNVTCDSSTIIGDDYQQWRDERIRQLNSLT